MTIGFGGKGNEGDPAALIKWFNEGADGAIDWGQPGDFEQCVAVATKHLDNPEGFCNERHQDAVGGPPGSEDKHTVRASTSAIRENQPMAMTMSRDAIIARFEADRVLTAAIPPPPPPPAAKEAPPVPGKTPPPPPPKAGGEGSPEDAKVDAGMEQLVGNLQRDIEALEKLQSTDPGTGKEVGDTKVQADLDQIKALVGQLVTDQAADSADTDNTAGKAPAAPPPPAAPAPDGKLPSGPTAGGTPPMASEGEGFAGGVPGGAEGVPNDADDNGPGPGEIEADLICQNPDCGHTAELHADDAELGGNSGPCAACPCPGMIPPADQINGPSDSTGSQGESQPAPTDDQMKAGAGAGAAEGEAFAPPPAPPVHPPPAQSDGTPSEADLPTGPEAAQLPPSDPMPNVLLGPQFTVPVAWLEGTPTGDGRQIAPDALTWRPMPLPLMGMDTSSHDPSGMSPNDPAVLIGRIEEITRDGNTGTASGHLLTTEDGMRFAQILEQMGRMGISIDVGGVGPGDVQITADPTAPAGTDMFDIPMLELLMKGEIMAMTVCPMAAFAGAYIVLGDGTDAPAGDLKPAPADAKMAIRYVGADESMCIPCATDGEPIVASGAGSTVEPSRLRPSISWFQDPKFEMGDGYVKETLDPKTGKMSGKFGCPITIEGDRIFGHIALWGVCHQSPKFLNNGQCVMAPRSRIDYAAFHGNGSVITAEGQKIGVGRMTADVGHADESVQVDFRRAMAHYDNSGLFAAAVRAGEDEFGVWVSGSIHPLASDEQIYTMQACPPSGDWRKFGAGPELSNVLFVNNAGFPMLVASMDPGTQEIERLVAAGVPVFTMPEETIVVSVEDRIDRMERIMQPVFGLARDQLLERGRRLIDR